MNQKKARMLRKAVGYNPREDPIKDRKYSVLRTAKVVDKGRGRLIGEQTGLMLATKGERLAYRQAKKLYKEGRI